MTSSITLAAALFEQLTLDVWNDLSDGERLEAAPHVAALRSAPDAAANRSLGGGLKSVRRGCDLSQAENQARFLASA